MRTSTRSLHVLLILLACLVPARAQDAGDWRADRDALVKKLVGNLESLADWCSANEIFAERDKVFVQILVYQPEHFRAHKGLKHVQMRDGKWVPPSEPAVSKNFNKGALSRFPDRYRAAVQPTCAALYDLAQARALQGADRQEVYALILTLDPEDPHVHAERGEVKSGETWVLTETLAAKTRRAQIKECARAALADAPQPETIVPDAADTALGVAWTACVGTSAMRVLSTGPLDEAIQVARSAHAAGDFYRALLDSKTTPDRCTVFILSGESDKKTFLEHHPAVSEKERAVYMAMSSAGLSDKGDLGTWAEAPEQRLDAVVRHVIARLMRTDLNVSPAQGWAFEGFGIYLTRELIGTRLTWYVLPQGYAEADQQSLRKRLMVRDCNWMNEAHEMLAGPRRPELATVLAKDINTLSLEDMLYGYVLAAYLLEARSGDAPRFLQAIGKSTSPERVASEVLGMDLAFLDQRVRQWLSERR